MATRGPAAMPAFGRLALVSLAASGRAGEVIVRRRMQPGSFSTPRRWGLMPSYFYCAVQIYFSHWLLRRGVNMEVQGDEYSQMSR